MIELTQENIQRWNQVSGLPLPIGVGELNNGLCAVARCVYTLTGKISDELQCVSQIARAMLIFANDNLPEGLMRDRLGAQDVRDAFLATTPNDDVRLVFVVAEQARQSALRALGYANVRGKAVDALAGCSPITDMISAKYAAKSAAKYAAEYAAESAAESAKYAAKYAAESAAESAKYAAESANEKAILLSNILAILGLK